MTLEEKFERVRPVLIGIWRFKTEKMSKERWCATWRYRGGYHDTYPCPGFEATLDKIWSNWQQYRKRNLTVAQSRRVK